MISKGVKVDDIENVTIITFKDIELREAFRKNNSLHIAISDKNKVAEDILIEFENGGLWESSQMSHIDVILDFPSKEKLERFIDYLTECKEQYPEIYGKTI